jgi:hypothetical protein
LHTAPFLPAGPETAIGINIAFPVSHRSLPDSVEQNQGSLPEGGIQVIDNGGRSFTNVDDKSNVSLKRSHKLRQLKHLAAKMKIKEKLKVVAPIAAKLFKQFNRFHKASKKDDETLQPITEVIHGAPPVVTVVTEEVPPETTEVTDEAPPESTEVTDEAPPSFNESGEPMEDQVADAETETELTLTLVSEGLSLYDDVASSEEPMEDQVADAETETELTLTLESEGLSLCDDAASSEEPMEDLTANAETANLDTRA